MKVFFTWNRWNEAGSTTVSAISVVEEVRNWVRNHVPHDQIHKGPTSFGCHCITVVLPDLQMNVVATIAGALHSAHEVYPVVTIKMTHEEARALEQKLDRQRSALTSGIRMLKETRSWFKDKRFAEIRRQLEQGL